MFGNYSGVSLQVSHVRYLLYSHKSMVHVPSISFSMQMRKWKPRLKPLFETVLEVSRGTHIRAQADWVWKADGG